MNRGGTEITVGSKSIAVYAKEADLSKKNQIDLIGKEVQQRFEQGTLAQGTGAGANLEVAAIKATSDRVVETNIALNATGVTIDAGITKATAEVEKPVDLRGTTVQKEVQELEGEVALVLVDKAGSEPDMHTARLKAAKNTVVDQALDGNSKGSAIEPGLLDDSALAADARAILSKNNAVVAVVEQVDKAENRPSVTANINITATGAKILENLNPLNALPGMHLTANKGFSLQGVTSRKFVGVGLHTSNHEVPSNEMFDQSIQPSHNQDTLSMMSSAIKNPKGGTDHTRDVHEDEMSEDLCDELVNSQELNTQETGSSTRQGGKAKEGAVAVIEQVMKASVAKTGSAQRIKRNEPLQMVLQEEANQKLELNLRLASSDEAEEDELIESCPEEEATSGDFSPKHNKKKEDGSCNLSILIGPLASFGRSASCMNTLSLDKVVAYFASASATVLASL
ncbi:hypothetical protein A4A49_25024 [Nicotiana attenuata]|uniref:Uncharacterized protein n=1 Tax=Nicotiana attenuata TaxID=49451 RepID=A0A1J6K8L4_NICAT|nr:hypothetical protein A4A49_25024 [Nicotiana attenuata]